MKEAVRLLVALAIAGLIYSYAVQDREPKVEEPSIPAKLCKPIREIPTRDGGRALGVLCLIPIPGSMEVPRNAPNPDFVF